MAVDEPGPTRRFRRQVLAGVVAVVALAVVAAVVAWALLRDGDDEDGEPPRAAAELASDEDLRALAAAADGPVFWAGPRPGMQYEVSETADGRIYIRYLPADVEAGDPRGDYLTVGTYPAEDAYPATQRLGEAEGAVVEELEGGGIAVYNESTPTSVYLAFPGINRQIEVYDPSPETARQLAYSGAIMPILVEQPPPEQTGQPVAATEEELRELAAETAHPVYWLGPREGVTYELTRLPNGQIYIRYLPEGIEIGDRRPNYETVGTYPTPNALEVLEESRGDDAVTFAVPGGGRAFSEPGTPTNVHFALPGENFQVEVFHPDDGRAEEIVRGGEAVPIE